MAKLPSFPFYPGDWLRNEVSGCSLEAQGLWLRMMIVMHDSQEYGRLAINGKPMSDDFIAKKCGISPRIFKKTLKELEENCVINRDEHGVIYSGRMVRDDRERQQNRERQKNFYDRNKGKSNGEPNGTPNGKPNTPFSSSPSTSNKNSATQAETAEAATPTGRIIWNNGVQMLIEGGMKNHNARSLLGKLSKEHGYIRLAECVAATMVANAVNPEEFLIGTLKNRAATVNTRKADPGKTEPAISPEEEQRMRQELLESICPICHKKGCEVTHTADEIKEALAGAGVTA